MPERMSSFDKIRIAAAHEDWETVDAALPELAELPEVYSWARANLDIEDPNLRDLAVSVLETSSGHIGKNLREELLDLMTNDPNPYVCFRAAFALFNHGDRSPQVVGKLRAALEDEDVAEIASGYLEELK